MTIIYGVDTDKPITPEQVRDAIVECFTLAHKKILEKDIGQFVDDMTVQEKKKIEEINVQLMIKSYFDEVGGDYANPTKNSIIGVCNRLAEFSKNFRNPEIIKKHYGEIMQLVDKLED